MQCSIPKITRSTNTIKATKSAHTSQKLISLAKKIHVCGDSRTKMKLRVLTSSLREHKQVGTNSIRSRQPRMIALQLSSRPSQARRSQQRRAKDLPLLAKRDKTVSSDPALESQKI